MRWRKDSERARTILLRGNYAEANFGDDALLVAAYRLLARHALRIVVEGGAAYRDDRLSGLGVRVPDHRRFDAIVYGGGTQFFAFDHDTPVTSVPFGRRILGKIARPTSVLGSIRARRRVRIESQTARLAIGFGIGPFPENSPSEAAAAKIVRTMALVWVRDRASETFCRRHGVETAVLSADLCFTSAFAEAVQPPAPTAPSDRRLLQVGIVLRDWAALGDEFFEAAIEAARRLRQVDVATVFFSSPQTISACVQL